MVLSLLLHFSESKTNERNRTTACSLFQIVEYDHLKKGEAHVMSVNMKYELKISYEDFKAAQHLHMRPRRGFRIVLYPLLALFALTAILVSINFVKGHGSARSSYILMGCIAYLLLIIAILIPSKWKRIYNQQKLFEVTFDYEFTESSLCSTSELGNVSLPWGKFHKWKENKKMFIVYQSDVMFHLIPKRIFRTEEEISRLRDILSESIGKAVT
jgi:hypothetical protein